MNLQLRPHRMSAERRLPFECVTLLLQGGGALGAYQGGVYEALAEADIHPDWVAGISIGAINAAIIAGNPPNSRVERLRQFWAHVTSSAPWDWLAACRTEVSSRVATSVISPAIGKLVARRAGAEAILGL
jgi:NTE family protein